MKGCAHNRHETNVSAKATSDAPDSFCRMTASSRKADVVEAALEVLYGQTRRSSG